MHVHMRPYPFRRKPGAEIRAPETLPGASNEDMPHVIDDIVVPGPIGDSSRSTHGHVSVGADSADQPGELGLHGLTFGQIFDCSGSRFLDELRTWIEDQKDLLSNGCPRHL